MASLPELLARVSLFEDLTSEEIALIAGAAQQRTFAEGGEPLRDR